jgi:hypothetical protein
MTSIAGLPKLFHIHRSAKRCLDILDELFGRDPRAYPIPRSGYLARFVRIANNKNRILLESPKLFYHRASGLAPITAIVPAVSRPLCSQSNRCAQGKVP